MPLWYSPLGPGALTEPGHLARFPNLLLSVDAHGPLVLELCRAPGRGADALRPAPDYLTKPQPPCPPSWRNFSPW